MSENLAVEQASGTPKKILIAYIPGSIGDSALEAGLAEAAVRNCPAIVVNAPRAGRTVDRKMMDEAAKERVIERARTYEVEMDIVQPIEADPVAAIEDIVASGEFSQLVIGLRKRSTVGKFVMGSTAQRLLLDVKIPVLAVK